MNDYDVLRRPVQRSFARSPADVTADGPLAALQRTAGNGAVVAELQRQEAGGGRSPVLDVIGHGGGRPLDAGVRSEMEGALGSDFSDVRVHDDSTAASSAEAVGAHAYTTGSEIVFGHGAYDPGSTDGKRTLAHELTHVIQQRSGPVDGTPSEDGVAVSDPGDRFELEAASHAEHVVSTGRAPGVPTQAAAGGGASLQRDRQCDDHDHGDILQMIQLQGDSGAPEEADASA